MFVFPGSDVPTIIQMYNPFSDVNGDVLSNILQFLEPIQVLVSICTF